MQDSTISDAPAASSTVSVVNAQPNNKREPVGKGVAARPPETAEQDNARDGKILIVDDEPTVVAMLKKHLRSAGYDRLVDTTNPLRAVELIRLEQPDLVILDIRMPGVGGLEILESLRNEDGLQHVPRLVLTSATDQETKLRALHLGATDFLTKPVDVNELLVRVRNTLLAKRRHDRLVQFSAQWECVALTDVLTGLGNRRLLESELTRWVTHWKRRQEPFSLFLLDVDHFKSINDCYGHQAGDQLLAKLADLLRNACRQIDVVARCGGEEFAVILPHTGLDNANQLAERIREKVSGHQFSYEGIPIRMTASVGVAQVLHVDTDASLYERSDGALYAAKHAGRNAVFFHDGNGCHPAAGTKLTHAAQSARPSVARHESSGEGQRRLLKHVQDALIMIVDDEPINTHLVRKLLKDRGYDHFVVVHESARALEIFRQERPDIVLLDVRMPDVNGLCILKEIRKQKGISGVPVLILTAETDAATKLSAFELGATDFLPKPVDPSELSARVYNSLVMKIQHDQLKSYSHDLELEVNLRTSELLASRREVVHRLARAGECRDDATGEHVIRVGRYAGIIGRAMGFQETEAGWLELAAQLHDVGKIGVPDAVLKKSGKLTSTEYQIMQGHCEMGRRILDDEWQEEHRRSSSPTQNQGSPLMKMAALVAESHHERWDGTGYPRGLSGEQIPIEGRITAVADVFDALTTQRHYKEAFKLDASLAMLEEGRGTHFDPQVLDAFLRCQDQILAVYHEYPDAR